MEALFEKRDVHAYDEMRGTKKRWEKHGFNSGLAHSQGDGTGGGKGHTGGVAISG